MDNLRHSVKQRQSLTFLDFARRHGAACTNDFPLVRSQSRANLMPVWISRSKRASRTVEAPGMTVANSASPV